jgi:hypothetical protein
MSDNSSDLFHEILSSIKDVIIETKSDIKDIKTDISDIKIDLSHHILRTDILQDEQKEQKKIVYQLQRDNWKLKGAFGLLSLILTILGVIALFKH